MHYENPKAPNYLLHGRYAKRSDQMSRFGDNKNQHQRALSQMGGETGSKFNDIRS